MSVKYTRVNWQDAPSVDTPVNAANLNHMDNGILLLSEEYDTDVPLMKRQIFDLQSNLEEYLVQNAGRIVTEWLDEHVTPGGSTVVIDDTLTIQGAAADAKKTGDELSTLKEDFDDALSPVKSLYNLCTGIQEGKMWAGWGGVGTKATISDKSTYMAATIIVAGQNYLSLNRAWIGPSFSFFTDDSDTIIKKVSDCYTGTTYVYTVPEGATKALISQNIQNPDINTYGVVALPVSTTINNYTVEDYPYNGTPSTDYFADTLKVEALNSETIADILVGMESDIGTNLDKIGKIQQISAKNRGWTNTGYSDHPNDGAFERVIVKLDPNNNLVFSGAATNNQYFYYLLFYDGNGNAIIEGKRTNTGNTSDTVAKADFPSNAVYAQIIFNRGGLANATITNGTNTQFAPSNTFDILKKISSYTEVGAEIVIPDTVTAVVGDTLQIYYDSIVKSTEEVSVQFLGTKGKALERYFEYTPSQSDVGNSSMTINVLKYSNIDSSFSTVIATKTITLKTVSVPSSLASEKHILCVGDSTIVAGDYVKELARRICGTGGTPEGNQLANVKFTGRLNKTIDGMTVGYEGFSGWSWNSYISSASKAIRFYVSGVSSLNFEAVYQDSNGCRYNIAEINVTNGTGNIRCIYVMGSGTTTPPTSGTLTRISGSGDQTISYTNIDVEEFSPFVQNGDVTFTPYVTEYCGGSVDYVMFSLGTNVIVNSNAEFSTIKSNMLNQMDTLIGKLHEQYPSAIVLLCTLQKGSMRGGFGNNFGSAYNANSQFYNNKVYQLNDAYIEFASTKSYVKLVDVSGEFDTAYDYPHTMKAVNTRDATNTEMVDTNFGHPSTIGYMQMADAMYRAFVGVLS